MLSAVLAALLGHWRRHPFALLTLLAGLAAATALWSGVQALNAEARASYDRAAAVAGGSRLAAVEARGGGRLPLDDWLALRRAGWKVSPLLEGDLRRGAASLRVVGIEPVTLPSEGIAGLGAGIDRLRAFVLPPGLGLASSETVARLQGVPDLPPLEPNDSLPPDTLVVDIGVAGRLLGLDRRISRMLMPAEAADRPLPPELAARLVVRPPGGRGEIGRLSASFHLNLTAFGALAFVVGLFIVHGAIGLAFEQRRPTLRTLRACGVPARALAVALAAELALLALVGGALGMAGGYLLAAALLPDLAASLRGLYGARLPGSLTLGPGWWAAGLGMALLGALVAGGRSLLRAVRLPPLATGQPEAWAAASGRARHRELALAGGCALAALAALLVGRGLAAGFVVLAGLLLAAALALPAGLAQLIALSGRAGRGPIAGWFWADARQALGPLSLALMALLLALAVNIGVGTMVESFRRTFVGYLDQRLAAELYVAGRGRAEVAAIGDWLAARPEVTAVLPTVTAATRVGDWPVEVVGFRDHATYRDGWPLIASDPDAWDRVADGRAVLVSEQLARRFGLWPGDPVTLPAPGGSWTVPVAAVYPDYGNTEGQVMVAVGALAAHWPDADARRIGVRVAPEAAAGLAADLRAAFALGDGQVVDQRALKAVSLGIFEDTFAVTVALNGLTLAVAGVALLTSLLTLAGARLVQVAPLWAIGVTRRRLAALELARALGLAALTAILALPLGLALAWVLTAVVNVRAFGWRLPVLLLPGQWATVGALALATAALAALWPALWLARLPPRALLQEFGNDR